MPFTSAENGFSVQWIGYSTTIQSIQLVDTLFPVTASILRLSSWLSKKKLTVQFML